jgi:hypothetical protein
VDLGQSLPFNEAPQAPQAPPQGPSAGEVQSQKLQSALKTAQATESQEKIDSLMTDLLYLDSLDANKIKPKTVKETAFTKKLFGKDGIPLRPRTGNSDGTNPKPGDIYPKKKYEAFLNARRGEPSKEENSDSGFLGVLSNLVRRLSFLFRSYKQQKLSSIVNGNKKSPLEELQLMAQIMSLTSVSSFDRYQNLKDDKDLFNGFNSSHVTPDDIIATLEIENKQPGNMKSLADQGRKARKVIPVKGKKGSLDYVKI